MNTRWVYAMSVDVHQVILSRRAQKDLEKVPVFIAAKLLAWIEQIQLLGWQEVKKRPGLHDEPLKGDRLGQRSIRLSKGYRAIFRLVDGTVLFIEVLEVNKHDY